MDLFELLSQDHREVDELFGKIEKTDNRGAKQREHLFQELREELERHTWLEEKIFYPELKGHSDTKELVHEALAEHREIKQMLREIGGLSAEDDQWSEMVNELKMAVQHHVREEQERTFPAARQKLDQRRIDDLGRQAEQIKQEPNARSKLAGLGYD
jgi:hypothetical protein